MNGSNTVYTLNAEALKGFLTLIEDDKTVTDLIDDVYGEGTGDAIVSFIASIPDAKLSSIVDAAIEFTEAYGLDIDDRAAQLAYFAVMMKARQYDRRFFTRNIQPHICAIQESAKMPEEAWGYFGPEQDIAHHVYAAFVDAKEYGSLIEPNVTLEELDALQARIEDMDEKAVYSSLAGQAIIGDAVMTMLTLMQPARMLTQKYDVVVTNPPYMGASGMGLRLSQYVKDNYPDSKSDMSTCFMEKTIDLCKVQGYMAMINIPVWMFLSSYEKLRHKMLKNNTYINMVHPGRGIFGSDFGTTSFVIGKHHVPGYRGSYRRLFKKQGEVESIEERERAFLKDVGCFTAQQCNFSKIPGAPVAYWLPQKTVDAFESIKLKDLYLARNGITTGQNDLFIRSWYEIAPNERKWFKCNKGGPFRRWYGNLDFVIDWEYNGLRLKNFKDDKGKQRSTLRSIEFNFCQAFTMSRIGSGISSFRMLEEGFIT